MSIIFIKKLKMRISFFQGNKKILHSLQAAIGKKNEQIGLFYIYNWRGSG